MSNPTNRTTTRRPWNPGRWVWLLVLAALVPLSSVADDTDDTDDQLQLLSRTGPQGVEPAAARAARDQLAARGVEILPRLLEAMDTASPVALNWYRTIYEQVVAREWEQPTPRFPVDVLKEHVRNPKHQGRVRRLVLTLLDRLDPQFRTGLIPTLLDDPEFRSDAVALVLQAGDVASGTGKKDAALVEYRRAFQHARRFDQVTSAASKLKGLGQETSVADHLGFVTDWYLIGPFDAPAYSGFAKVFPPEERVDLNASYAGQGGVPLRWKRHHETDSMGQINLNQVLVATREAVGYAYAELDLPLAREAQVRCGADDNCTVWLNGKKVLARLQWLNGSRPDRFVANVHLQAGKNRLLVKICQGPQHVDSAVPNNWSLQLRFCDAEGGGVGLKSAL